MNEMAHHARSGSALIIVLLMTTAIMGYASYVWYMASLAERLSRQLCMREQYAQATSGAIEYAINLVRNAYPSFCSSTQDHTVEKSSVLPRVTIDENRVGFVRFSFIGYKEYVRVSATLFDAEKPVYVISGELHQSMPDAGGEPTYRIDAWNSNAA